MSMVDIAVTRELIRALEMQKPALRADEQCWCPNGWPIRRGHLTTCKVARAAIYEARKAGY